MSAQRILFSLFVLAACAPAPAQHPVSFEKQIMPILEARCVKCHGAEVQMGKLDLRSRQAALKGGDKGPSLLPGNPAQSILYKRVAGLEKPAMPMDGNLKPEEVEAIRIWINAGAPWTAEIGAVAQKNPLAELENATVPEGARGFWSFQKPERKPVPRISDPRWAANPVDAFLKKEMDAKGLKPAPKADRKTLIRRASLDLTGLPPTPEQVRAFENDSRPDAWQRVIDGLLASPHYGERWGRHWLDIARYADSNGYEHDFDRPNAWRYRDYVIRAFNRDTPYDRFLLEQLAGDELEDTSNETLIATGFLRSYAKVGFREKDNPQFRFDYLDDMIATLGRGVMGLTVHCARCHNHKFDPILQKDYYRMQASLFSYVEVDHPLVPREQANEFYRKQEEVNTGIAALRVKINTIEEPYKKPLLEQRYKRFPPNVLEAIHTPEEKRTPGQVLLANQIIRTTRVSSQEVNKYLKPEERAQVKQYEDEIAALEKQRPAPIPVAMGITDGDYRFTPDGPGDEPAPGKGVKQEVTEGSYLHRGPDPYKAPPSYFLFGGDMSSRGSIMKPGFPSVLTQGNIEAEMPPPHQRTSGRRRALAEWLTSPGQPVTSRVMVNRIWHHHFGRGIVATIDNFGHTGDRPTHPELLDWLAVEFRERGWSFKQMHRLLMTSEAYQMASAYGHPENVRIDPENSYLWRFRQQRLEAEVIRDSILFTAGTLNTLMEGPPVFPKLPQDVLRSMKNGIWKIQPDGAETWRRSVYVYRKRGLPFPFFEVFDLPDQTITCGRRNVSTVATQALTLLNNEFVLDHSKRFAERVRKMAPDGVDAQLQVAYELALSRPPSAEEKALGLSFLEKNSLDDLAHVLLNLSEFLYLR